MKQTKKTERKVKTPSCPKCGAALNVIPNRRVVDNLSIVAVCSDCEWTALLTDSPEGTLVAPLATGTC